MTSWRKNRIREKHTRSVRRSPDASFVKYLEQYPSVTPDSIDIYDPPAVFILPNGDMKQVDQHGIVVVKYHRASKKSESMYENSYSELAKSVIRTDNVIRGTGWNPEEYAFELSSNPTEAQLRQISKISKMFKGNIIWEITDGSYGSGLTSLKKEIELFGD